MYREKIPEGVELLLTEVFYEELSASNRIYVKNFTKVNSMV